ncbi:hypothetical protein DPMN_130198 [Dreissena polymorpha]|uniref:Uncharacterized protein n=1 Tax=Dreissena polymorpha TaxID=45954 RepID=A0A9D4JXD8_DREPO|nr:hypothetical protein DPMN_130198 [Dreissena polymorpha]
MHKPPGKTASSLNLTMDFVLVTPVTTVHDLLTNYDSGAQIDMAIMDFSKTFDTVPHTPT